MRRGNEGFERGRKRSRSPEGHASRRRSSHHENKQQDRHVEEWHDGGREEKRNRYNRDFEGFERRNEPTNVIMLRGLNALTTQEKLTDVLKAFGPIEDVRLIRNKATGESRCFAFVDFATVEEAAAFMEYYGGILELDERTVQMDFSRQKEHPTGEYKDWLCAQCSGSNFARRAVCYLCHAPKPANPAPANVIEENRDNPSPVLVARGLNPLTTEDTIFSVFSSFAPVKEVRLIRDKHTGQSRGFTFVEFNTTEEATFTLQNSTHLQIDDNMVRISYARKNWDRNIPGHHEQEGDHGFAQFPGGPQVSGNVALEQAQWAMQQRKAAAANATGQAFAASNIALVSAHGQAAPASEPGAIPTGNYVLDESSGYYYNTLTGIYYDPKTGYYYNPMTQQYLLQDPSAAALPPPSNALTVAAAPTQEGPEIKLIMNEKPDKKQAAQDKEKKKQKTVRNKKLSAEMQRWNAKQKELQQEPAEQGPKKIKFSLGSSISLSSPSSAPSANSAASATTTATESSFVVVEEGLRPDAPESSTKPDTTAATVVAAPPTETAASTVSSTVADITASSASASETLLALPPLCLLCRRQFDSTTDLDNHRQISKLHQSNKEALQAKLIVHRMKEATKQQNKAKLVQSPGYIKKKKKKKAKRQAALSGGAVGQMGQAPTAENKGSQLLRKMGWKDGEGLGKEAHGITAPIDVVVRSERAGIGADSIDYAVDSGDSYQQATKKKARARLENLMKRD